MTIHLSQVLLVSILAFFILYIFRLRTLFFDRLIYILFAAAGIFLVIDPDSTSRIANLLGIGRGTDLLVYLFILASLFYAVTVRSQMKRLQAQLTHIVRQLAISQPMQGPIGQPTQAPGGQDAPQAPAKE